MPLNLRRNDGDFTPFLKYNAKAGRFYARPSAGGDEIEIVAPRLAFDFANIKTGWIYYPEGAAPERVWDPSLEIEAPQPAGPKQWRRGFEVMVFGPDKAFGGEILGLREFSSVAANTNNAILLMYSDYELGAASNPGKVPVFKCEGVTPVQGKFGTNYEPRFKLEKWVERSKVPDFPEPKPAAPYNPRQAQEPPAAAEGSFGAALDDEIPFEMSWQ